jgi:hypothetical protein
MEDVRERRSTADTPRGLGENSGQCQEIGGGNGAAFRATEEKIGGVASPTATTNRENKSHIPQFFACPVIRSAVSAEAAWKKT